LTSSNSCRKRPGPDDRKIAFGENCPRFHVWVGFISNKSRPIGSVCVGDVIGSAHIATSSWSKTKPYEAAALLRQPRKRASLEKQSTTPITDAEAASLAASESSQQTTFAKHQSLPMVRSVLLAALVCAAPIRPCLAQEAKVSVDMMGIGGLSCAHWQSTQAHRVEGTIWIYGFWTGLNYVASASEQTETKVDTAAAMAEVKKTCAQRPSQVLASAAWTAYLALHKR
jgi:hypothetical protein